MNLRRLNEKSESLTEWTFKTINAWLLDIRTPKVEKIFLSKNAKMFSVCK